MAKLYFHYGAMNSGKTIELLRAAHNYEEIGMKPFLVKPGTDTKGENKVTSRVGIDRMVDLVATPDMDLWQAIPEHVGGEPIGCIFADEAQFFSPNQIDQLFALTLDPGIPVMSYGLRGDFRTRGFPGSTRLLEIAHVIKEIRTVCRCGSNAIFNGRKINGEFVLEGDQVAIDGSSMDIAYESLCGACYAQHVGLVKND
ncbi:MAG TPA: thymidine kinase [Candidatus Saccharimonadales bacterium]|nr:thymidine kinase [Candidatus Saccharimonadales bacterium]